LDDNWNGLTKARWRSLFRRERIASPFVTGFDALTRACWINLEATLYKGFQPFFHPASARFLGLGIENACIFLA